MKSPALEYEKALPLDCEWSCKMWDEAISKAKLIYDNVELISEYQCALLYNGEMDKKKDFTVKSVIKDFTIMYVSEKERKVNALNIHVDGCRQMGGADVNLMIIRCDEDDEGKLRSLGVGVIGQNGFIKVPPVYTNVEWFGNDFLIGRKFKMRGQEGLEDIYNTKGEILLRLPPPVIDITYGEMKYKNKEMKIIYVAHSNPERTLRTGGQEYDRSLYAEYDGKLYFLIRFPADFYGLEINNGELLLKQPIHGIDIKKRWTAEEILMAEEIKPQKFRMADIC